MTGLTVPIAPPGLTRRPAFGANPTTVALLAVAALAWAGVIAYARHLGNGAGTMGMTPVGFVAMWALMMTAMMAPAVAPVASLYARTITSHRPARVTLFIAGYILVWVAAGIPTYAVLRLVDRVAANGDTMRDIAVGVLGVAGAYQLSPLKTRCLRHCRSPLAQLLGYGNVKGRFRDLKVALHHGAYCLGCCWALMALFVAFGVMSVWVMLALAAVVVAEKVLRRQGEAIGRVAGAACLALAVLVLASPSVASALVPGVASMSGRAMHM